MKANEIKLRAIARRATFGLLAAGLVSCGDDESGADRRSDDAGLDRDAAVICVLVDGSCPAGCEKLEAKSADLTDAEPCFGEPETLACRPVLQDSLEVPIDGCIRSKDGHRIAIAGVSLRWLLLETDDYVMCTEAEATRLREYPECED